MSEYFEVVEMEGWDVPWGIVDPFDGICAFWTSKEDADRDCARMNEERLSS